MTVYIPIRDGRGKIREAICRVCADRLVGWFGEEHIFLLMLEHAAQHDRK